MKTTVNNGKRTALFWFLAATFFLSLMAHGAGAAKFGTLRNSDWVVTNAWIAASNRVDSFVSSNCYTIARDATNYTDSATNGLMDVLDGKVSMTNESGTAYIGWYGDIFRFSYGIQVDASPIILPPYLDGVYFGYQTLLDILDERSLAATNYTDISISTNNAAFVAAVTNCPVVIAAADGITLGDFGEYGTLGSLLAALAAAITWLKTNKANKTDLPYPFAEPMLSNGILTITPRTVATYTAGTTAAAFTVAVGTGVNGAARDCVLVVDCAATGAVAPTVTWGTHFHPRTDTATDLAIVEAEKRAVFYISEYAAGEFAVGGWVETAGGSEA